MGLDVLESPSQDAAAAATEARGGEVPAVVPSSKLNMANLHGNGFESPVEFYSDATEVPEEFVIYDPKKVPNRCWGDNDASRPNVDFPVIDMSPLIKMRAGPQQHQRLEEDEEDSKRVMAEIGRACENWGFFQAVNHRIPENLLERVLEVANEFFRLPLEEKRVYSVKPGETEGYGRLDFYVACLTGNAGAVRTRFWHDAMRHSIRPKRTLEELRGRIPDKPVDYRRVMEEYTQGLEEVFKVVWTSLSVYLGLESDTLQNAQNEDAHLILRLNAYPKCPEPEKVLGLGGHKDFGSITALLQDEVGGLQVEKPGTTGWLDVRPKKGSLLINIGNQVEILSNGRLHSVMHRAMVNRNCSRLSIAAFATPSPKCTIRPIPELLEKTQQVPRYRQLLYGEYVSKFTQDVRAGISPQARYEINRN